MAIHNDVGKKGETIAQKFLTEIGYHILSTNARMQKSEVDIIARHEDKLIFIEVKTRKNLDYRVQDLISSAKQISLIRAAELYKEANNYEGEILFELICVILDSASEHRIEHYKDILYEL